MQFNGNEPIFLQIAAYYRRMIEISALKEGDMLPSVREVAVTNRVNPNTVQRAFSLLGEEGYISSLPKKGNFVSYKAEGKQRGELKKSLQSLLDSGYSKEDIRLALQELEEKR